MPTLQEFFENIMKLTPDHTRCKYCNGPIGKGRTIKMKDGSAHRMCFWHQDGFEREPD